MRMWARCQMLSWCCGAKLDRPFETTEQAGATSEVPEAAERVHWSKFEAMRDCSRDLQQMQQNALRLSGARR